MSNARRRVVTGGIYGVVLLAAMVAPVPAFPALALVLVLLAYVELIALLLTTSYQVPVVLAVMALEAAVLTGFTTANTESNVRQSVVGATYLMVSFAIQHVADRSALGSHRVAWRVAATIVGSFFAFAGGILLIESALPPGPIAHPTADIVHLVISVVSVLLLLVLVIGANAVDRSTQGRPNPFEVALVGAVGAVVLGQLFGFLVALWQAGASFSGVASSGWPVWLAIAFLPTWAADIAGYVVGRNYGGGLGERFAGLRRAVENPIRRVSPRKTLEGSLAGIAAAGAAAALLGVAFGLPPIATLIASAFLGLAALAGDLLESVVKRAAGAKDSGSLLPGHGGVLDRIDSLLFVAPLALIVLTIAREVG